MTKSGIVVFFVAIIAAFFVGQLDGRQRGRTQGLREVDLLESMLDWEQECLCGVQLKGGKVVPGEGYSYTCATCGRLYAWAWREPDDEYVPRPTTYQGLLEDAEQNMESDKQYIVMLKEKIAGESK